VLFFFLSRTHYCYIFIHHQPINVPTAGAQAIFMDYSQGVQAITTRTHSGLDLTRLPKHREAQDNKFLLTHPMTDQRCLASAIAAHILIISSIYITSLYIPKELGRNIYLENHCLPKTTRKKT
jgi:hypothetical protein